MYYTTTTNTLSKQDPNAPGVVLAVSPNGSQLLINDQVRHLFYLYTVSSGTSLSFGGMGSAAAWTPDSKTLYIYDNANLNTPATCSGTPAITGHTDTLYVYNVNTGWSTYPLPPSPLPTASLPTCTDQPNVAGLPPAQTPAIVVPGVGAYLSGYPTVAHTWCPAGTVGNSASIQFYPLGDSVPTQTDALAATTDGQHVLGAALVGGVVQVSDIGVTLPSITTNSGTGTSPVVSPATCPVSGGGALSPLTIQHTFTAPVPVSGVSATAVNQVIPAPNSALAFITYSGDTPGAALPYYMPGSGTVSYVTLNNSSAVTAPLAGAFSPDNTLFFLGTGGDNLVHYIGIPITVSAATPPTDTQQVAPALPACTPVSAGGNDAGCIYTGTGTVVPVTAIAVKPRSTT
jgi:hypothetical protein